MKATITIDMDNAAFENPGELPWILRRLAATIQDNPTLRDPWLYDHNGNLVGRLIMEAES